jgi:hypothetical protein
MRPDVFNSREDAVLIWLVVVSIFVLSKDFRGITSAVFAVIRSIIHPRLLLLFGTAFAYSACLVFAAARLGLWHQPALKVTIYWFLATALAHARTPAISYRAHARAREGSRTRLTRAAVI